MLLGTSTRMQLFNLAVVVQMVRLEQLMQGDQDLSERLLGPLTPTELALLACASKTLCSSVAALPEALWQARALLLACCCSLACVLTAATAPQAAAQRTVPPCHPVLAAPSVRAYFQQRRRVRSSIATGACETHLLEVPEGFVSPDLSRTALWGKDRKVHVWDVSNQRLLHRWTLPKPPFPKTYPVAWGWCAASRALAIPCGHLLDESLVVLDTHRGLTRPAGPTGLLTPGAAWPEHVPQPRRLLPRQEPHARAAQPRQQAVRR